MKKIAFWFIKKLSPIFQPTGLQRISPIKEIYDYFIKILKPDMLVIEGNKMYLDDRDSLRISVNGYCDKLQTIFFKKYVKKENVVLDIGAHIGYYSLIAARLVGSKGKVYAFEPNKSRFFILKRNVKLNEFDNIVCINKAVSDFSGISNLSILFDRSIDRIQVVSIDDFLKDKKIKVDVIKIDVDGSDMEVLKGMEKILNSNSSIKLFLEYWPAGLKLFGSSGKEFLTFLNNKGFKFMDLDERQTRKKVVSKEYLLKKYTQEFQGWRRISYTNLLCFRNSSTLI